MKNWGLLSTCISQSFSSKGYDIQCTVHCIEETLEANDTHISLGQHWLPFPSGPPLSLYEPWIQFSTANCLRMHLLCLQLSHEGSIGYNFISEFSFFFFSHSRKLVMVPEQQNLPSKKGSITECQEHSLWSLAV